MNLSIKKKPSKWTAKQEKKMIKATASLMSEAEQGNTSKGRKSEKKKKKKKKREK
jgi:hypothetical protein